MKENLSKLKCIVLFFALLMTAQAHGLTGSWSGELALGQTKLKLVFNFSEDTGGTTLCTLDSPWQGVKGLPTTIVLCSTDSISLNCSAIGATYTGRIASGTITGVFRQRGYSFPLNLSPEAAIEDRRPQTPKPPFPYNVIDTTFTAPDGAIMSATLTMPRLRDNKKVPVVIMVTGSGPQNRDEELFDHRPFAVITDYLVRNGIGTLRYDDRGTGKSTGNFLKATTETFKDDARSGIFFLRTLDTVGKVGVLGHSEGGTIAFMLGAEKVPDFIVSLAGMAVTGKEALMMQNSHTLNHINLSDADKDNSLKFIEIVFDTMAEQARKKIYKPIDIDSILTNSGLPVNEQIVASVKMTQKMRTPWFDALLNLNPREYLSKITCPVLAINGERDTQVDGVRNIAVIKETVPQAETRLIPELNHLMQRSITGESSEYGEISETVSPEVLKIVADFVTKLSTTTNQ